MKTTFFSPVSPKVPTLKRANSYAKKGIVIGFYIALGLLGFINVKGQDTAYLKANVAIIDVIIRSISPSHFVKQVLIVDFLGKEDIQNVLMFFGEGYTDDGIGFDPRSNDGMYTSIDSFPHSLSAPYYADTLSRSVSDKAIKDKEFEFDSKLDDYLSTYVPPGPSGKWIIKIDCDISWCSCSNPNCNHCYISWGPHTGCVGCPIITNCHFEINWEW